MYGAPLIVSVAPDDRCRLKGENRPYFSAEERLEAVDSVAGTDFVEISAPLDAIRYHKPSHYVKGPECQFSPTPAFLEEKALVEQLGGVVVYTDDAIYSSTGLMERLLRDLGI